MPDELDKECINYTKGKCLLENELVALEEAPVSCENCFRRWKLKEGEEKTITETYTLKRINGKLVEIVDDVYIEL